MSVLTRITARAKQIYKKGKAGISWIAAIKRASAQVKNKQPTKVYPSKYHARGGKAVKRKRRRRVGSVGKGPRANHSYITVPNVAGIGRVKRTRRKSAARKTKSVSARYRAEIKSKLSAALLAYDLADTIRATKAAQKRKVKYRKILKAL